MVQTVLLAGATGMFGSRVADKLLERPNAKVRLLVRSTEKNGKRDVIAEFVSRGAEVVTGDVADAASLDGATRGVDVIVSTLQGGPDVILDGQMSLANIGKKNGVRRILPSDYALDLFKATSGEHMMFDLRRRADEAISTMGIEHVHVLQGAFMELFGPGMGTVDYANGTVTLGRWYASHRVHER